MPRRSIESSSECLPLVIALLVTLGPVSFVQAAEPTFQADIRPIVQARCVKCHGPDEKSGNVNFAAITDDQTASRQRKLWRKAVAQLEAGTMPPPDANVSQIKDEPGQKKTDIQTFREKLSQHAHDAACAGCHRKMDPLGFALDNYNAVGRWRDKLGDQPLDVTGELPTGEKLNGVTDLKRVILARKDDFVRNLTEQLLTYALGRELEDCDDCPVRQIATQLKADDYRFSTLVMEIVKSYPFQYRKNPVEK